MNLELLYNYKNNPDIIQYSKVLNSFFPDANKCRICEKHIYYEGNKFRIKKTGKIEILGKSFKTVKKHGHGLSACESCLSKKFPNWKNLNKSRIFNTLNEITIWAFNIKDTDRILYKTGVTKLGLIKKYGEREGLKRWKKYRDLQAESNSYEYKKIKYKWTVEDFDKFNKSRGITLNNLTKKYGKSEGLKRWDSYIQKQSETKSFEYMVDKFGLKKAKEINKGKALTLNNFVLKYGEIEGSKKYQKYINRNFSFYSKESQILFDKIDQYIGRKYNTYYGSKNTEFGVNLSIGYKKLDYYIKELNLCIEYNGNIWHANPKYFNKFDTPNPFNPNLTADEIWKNDSRRYRSLMEEKYIKTIVIWETNINKFDTQKFLKDHGILF
jgi:hypothetical protein